MTRGFRSTAAFRGARCLALVLLGSAALLALGAEVRDVQDEAELRWLSSGMLRHATHPPESALRRLLVAPAVSESAANGLRWSELLQRESGLELASEVLGARPALSQDPRLPEIGYLWRLMREGRSREVERLVEADAASGNPAAASLLALARLDQGRRGAALVPRRPDRRRTHLDRIRARLEHGDRRFVFDREGRFLASLETVPSEQPLHAAADLEALGWGSWLATADWLPAQSGGVEVALDLELSRRLQEAMGRSSGSVVVLDLATGDVLAAAAARRTAQQNPDHFLTDRREPASIAKLVTASAGLRAGLDLDRWIAQQPCRGHVAVDGGYLYCPVVAGRMSGLDRAMAWSCNTTFGRLGLELGRSAVVDELRRFGFVDDVLAPSSDSPGGARSGAGLRPESDGTRWLAETAVGLNHTELTTLHAARIAAVFGSDGRLVTPRWVRGRTGFAGLHRVPDRPVRGERIVGAAVVERIRQAMVEVALDGTGAGLAPAGFPVAMKTGTASEPADGFHVNYIGYGPSDAARYAFAVRITHHRTSRGVRQTARAVTRRVLRVLADYDRSRSGAARREVLGSWSEAAG